MIQVLIPEVSEKNFPGIQEDYCSREHAALWGEHRADKQKNSRLRDNVKHMRWITTKTTPAAPLHARSMIHRAANLLPTAQ